MRRFFTSESVTEGHPDKVCDRIADSILDELLKLDPHARSAIECCAAYNTLFLTGEVSWRTQTDTQGTYVSATSAGDITYVKAVNATDSPVTAEVEGDFDFGEMLRIVRMAGEPGDFNSPEEPEKLVPVEVAPTAARTAELPPHSFSVLIFRK